MGDAAAMDQGRRQQQGMVPVRCFAHRGSQGRGGTHARRMPYDPALGERNARQYQDSFDLSSYETRVQRRTAALAISRLRRVAVAFGILGSTDRRAVAI